MLSEVNTVIHNFNTKPLKQVVDLKESHIAYSGKEFGARKTPALNSSDRLEKMRRYNIPRNFITSTEFSYVKFALMHG